MPACLQALSEVLAMVKKYRRKQRMEASSSMFACCLEGFRFGAGGESHADHHGASGPSFRNVLAT